MGEHIFERNRSAHGCLAGDFLLCVIFYSWLFSVETNQNRQLWGAAGELNTSLWLGAAKILSAKQISWGLTCGPYFVTESGMQTVIRIA